MNSLNPLFFDNKLLYIFVEIYQHKSVSSAANALEMTQPAVSIGLRKLREHYNNPLFTRVGYEMQGSELAHELYPKFLAAIESLREAYSFTADFNPKQAKNIFYLMMSDIGDMVLLPNLLKVSQKSAPFIGYDMSSSYLHLKERMQQGEIDLAVGYVPELEAGFYHKRLISQYYVGLVRKDHPRLNSMKIDSMVYFEERHIDVSNNVSEDSLIERELKALSQKRHIILRLSNYLGLSRLLLSSDLVATVPQILAEQLCESQNLEMFTLPLELYNYPIFVYWHEKRHKDADHIWLRQQIFKATELTRNGI